VSLAELEAIEAAHVVPSYARMPLELVRGAGTRLWDADGEEYLDFLSGISVLNVGHCHPAVVTAVREQVGTLTHVTNLFYTEPAMRLAQRLADSSLGGKVFFCNSGAEANEAALKLVRKARPGGEIVVVRGAFHGRTYGALSATPQESKQAPFAPLVPGFVSVAPIAEAIAEAVDEQTAAVLLEPVQGESGVYELSAETLRAARDACDAVGAALIFDEVQCGLGRTGTLWAYEHSGVVPDLMTVAKALGGGLPIGAVITNERFAGGFEPGDHGSTFAGGPVQCAAGLAVLEVVSDIDLLSHVREAGERAAHRLAEMPGVVEVRGRGFMLAAELASTRAEPATDLVGRALREERLVLNATGPTTIRLLPPLTITDAQLDDALNRLARLLDPQESR
jgi:acetylornithine/N-succinyldiaminopimelate aminotransferase